MRRHTGFCKQARRQALGLAAARAALCAADIYHYSTILLPLQIGKAGKSSEKLQNGRAFLVYLCSMEAYKPLFFLLPCAKLP